MISEKLIAVSRRFEAGGRKTVDGEVKSWNIVSLSAVEGLKSACP